MARLMHYFIHVVTDQERIIDPEGAAFPDLNAAKKEAIQSARDLMAEELRCGRPVPLGWRVQIANDDGAIVHVIDFMSIMFGKTGESRPRELVFDVKLVERAKATFARVRRRAAQARADQVRGITAKHPAMSTEKVHADAK